MTSSGLTPQLPLPFAGVERFDFDAFQPGANGELVAQLRQAALGDSDHNVFLWGIEGAGKSHLLHACCNLTVSADRQAVFIPLGQCDALSPLMLDGLDEFDIACMDELDAIAGKEAWEAAVFHLFNRMRERARPLIIAARNSPRGSGLSLKDLESRLSWDLVYHVEPMNEADRHKALLQRAARRGVDIPEEVMTFLARRVGRDTRTLFNWLDRLDTASLAAKKRLTVPFVRELLEAHRAEPPGTT